MWFSEKEHAQDYFGDTPIVQCVKCKGWSALKSQHIDGCIINIGPIFYYKCTGCLESEDDIEYCEQCKEILRIIANALNDASYCPFCGKDIRPKFDCKNCEMDHLGKSCYRDGAHTEDCIVLKAQRYI